MKPAISGTTQAKMSSSGNATGARGHRNLVLAAFGEGKVGAEIGVFKARFSKQILAVAKPRKLYLVDPWLNAVDPSLSASWYAAGSENDMETIYQQVRQDLRTQLESGQVELLRGPSVEAMAQIPDGSLDFVYVDGDHRYEAVRADLELAMQKTRPGAVIALDDYILGGWWGDGVIRAANEFIGAHARILRIAGAMNGQVVLQRIDKVA